MLYEPGEHAVPYSPDPLKRALNSGAYAASISTQRMGHRLSERLRFSLKSRCPTSFGMREPACRAKPWGCVAALLREVE